MSRIKIVVAAGALAFVGIIALQVYLLRQAFDYEEKKFSQNIQVSLLEVANEINAYYGYVSPHVNPVHKVSRDYYVVNMRNDFEARTLELLLTNKFKAKGIKTNFEYAIYDCETDAMLYGSYVNLDVASPPADPSNYFPKASTLVYYFAVRFPGLDSFIYASLTVWVLLCCIMLITLFIYLYAIYIILQQQKFANLQRDFINNMTHEFKTPLASILIASNYLSNHPALRDNEKMRQYAEIISGQGRKLDQHLEKIRNLARNDAQPMQLNKEMVDVPALLQTTIAIIRLKYPEAGIEVDERSANITVEADAFHFGNVIYNFLDNSIKYCAVKPRILVTLLRSDAGVTLTFKDNGIGINPRHLKNIFERFWRAPESKQLAVNGFGLGLYYVKKICELHQWKISAQSKPGEGTSITLLIPIKQRT